MPVAIAFTIASTIISGIIGSRLSAYAATARAAEEFYYFKDLKDSQIEDIAIILGQNTSIPYYEWFKVLRTVQDLKIAGMNPTEIDPPIDMLPDPPPKDNKMLYMILGGLGLAFIVARGKKR